MHKRILGKHLFYIYVREFFQVLKRLLNNFKTCMFFRQNMYTFYVSFYLLLKRG